MRPKDYSNCAQSARGNLIRLLLTWHQRLSNDSPGTNDQLPQLQRTDRILLQDQRLNFRTKTGLGEILHPAVRGDQWEIRAKQHLVLELRVRVADELRRKVFRRPTGQIDV